jgi:hypothetical protein
VDVSVGRVRDELDLHLLRVAVAARLALSRTRRLHRPLLYFGALGAIPQNLLVFSVLWYVCYWLYQRKIFFKI